MTSLKSIWAVTAGFLLAAICSILTTALLEAMGILPKTGVFFVPLVILVIIYQFAYTSVGGYLTTKLAPKHTTTHILALGVVVIIALVICANSNWAPRPQWYFILSGILALPSAWVGNKLYTPNASKKKK